MLTIVTRTFEASGKQLEIGELVDSSTWRHEAALIEQRRLRPATEEEIERATAPRTTELVGAGSHKKKP